MVSGVSKLNAELILFYLIVTRLLISQKLIT